MESDEQIINSSAANNAVRRPTGYWQTFNKWYRSHMVDGSRPSYALVKSWYEKNSGTVWPAKNIRPDLREALAHAKGLRSSEEVKKYNKNYKTKKGIIKTPSCASSGLVVSPSVHTSLASASLPFVESKSRSSSGDSCRTEDVVPTCMVQQNPADEVPFIGHPSMDSPRLVHDVVQYPTCQLKVEPILYPINFALSEPVSEPLPNMSAAAQNTMSYCNFGLSGLSQPLPMSGASYPGGVPFGYNNQVGYAPSIPVNSVGCHDHARWTEHSQQLLSAGAQAHLQMEEVNDSSIFDGVTLPSFLLASQEAMAEDARPTMKSFTPSDGFGNSDGSQLWYVGNNPPMSKYDNGGFPSGGCLKSCPSIDILDFQSLDVQ